MFREQIKMSQKICFIGENSTYDTSKTPPEQHAHNKPCSIINKILTSFSRRVFNIETKLYNASMNDDMSKSTDNAVTETHSLCRDQDSNLGSLGHNEKY